MNNNNLTNLFKINNLEELIGLKNINHSNSFFTKIIDFKKFKSHIIYGKTGIGKSCLAELIAQKLNLKIYLFYPASDNKKIWNEILQNCFNNDKAVIVIEEMHRLNRIQQDMLLRYLENENIQIIGITTENPYYSVNPSLRSRLFIFELKQSLLKDFVKDVQNLIKRLKLKLQIELTTIEYLCLKSNKDVRTITNILQTCYEFYQNEIINNKIIDYLLPDAKILNFRENDRHHDLKSGLQKSIRGSDVDASLYYLGELLLSGDFKVLTRRLIIIGYEDIGLANPPLCARVTTACNTFEKIGMPEGRIILSQIVIEMALSPKSNSAEVAIDQVFKILKTGSSYDLPKNLKNLKKYLYPPNYQYSWVKQLYLPIELKNSSFYKARIDNPNEKKLLKFHNQLIKPTNN